MRVACGTSMKRVLTVGISHIPTMADQMFFLMSLLGSLEMDFTQMVFMKWYRLYRKQALRGVWVDSLKGHCLFRPAHCTQESLGGEEAPGNWQKDPKRQKIPECKSILHPENPDKTYSFLIQNCICSNFPLLFCPSVEDQEAA